MRQKPKRRVAFRTKRQNRFGMFLVSVVVVLLLAVISVNSFTLKQKQKTLLAEKEVLETQIAQEENRTLELQEFKKYTQTQAYIEEVAKDKLGLVREGEIVFKMK